MLRNSNMTGATDTLMTRFTQALASPIHTRCAELTVLIDRCSSKDLQHLFPTLMESIFGTSGGVSWRIRSVTSAGHTQDFNTLVHFLGPLGPVFRLIYKLLTDIQVKYEYSINHVPAKVRQILDIGKVPPFYTDLLNVDTQSRKIYSLSLNAFDYYMFHFAYHLTNPWQQRNSNASVIASNTVYYVLCCDYLLHFLPTDPNIVVLPQLIHFTGKNPTIIPPQSVSNRPMYTSKLFKTNVLQQSSNDISSLHQPMQQHPRGEIWRSETVVQVFIDIWLNNDKLNTENNFSSTFNPQPKVNELPTGEYTRIIRILVKRLHAFSASGKNDTTPLGELKKIVQPMLQGPMYVFLRHLVYRWPLDGSFRLVLELWLSFIQPWRYTADNNNSQLLNDDDFNQGKYVDDQYIGFIADNLLAYTVIFQQLLPRFTRVDLASPKNAHMLFRVAKVFGQPNLVKMIREVESCIDDMNHSPTHSYNAGWSSNLPPLSPTSCWSTNTSLNTSNLNLSMGYQSPIDTNISFKNISSQSSFHVSYQSPARLNLLTNKWGGIVRHRIIELEGPEFCYKPMFTRQIAPEVYQLINQIQFAEQTAVEIIQKRREESKKRIRSSFFGFFISLFEFEEPSLDEFSMCEREKVVTYLYSAKENLVEIFGIDERIHSQNLGNVSYAPSDRSSLNESLPQNIDFSPRNARQRSLNLKYQGDPDLHPIRSNECGVFVRILYQVAQKINEHYSTQLRTHYYRTDFIGKVTRQILCPPMTTFSYDKSVIGHSPRVRKVLPPRVSFRYFGSHYVIAYALIGLMLWNFIGNNSISFIFLAFLCWCIRITVKALFDKNTDYFNNHDITNDHDVSF